MRIGCPCTVFVFLGMIAACFYSSNLAAFQWAIDKGGAYDLTPQTTYLEDSSNQIDSKTITELLDQFRPVDSQQGISFGYSDSSWWFRVEILAPNTSMNRWFLRIGFMQLDHIELYRLLSDKSDLELVWQGGDLYPSGGRLINDSAYLIPLDSSITEEPQTYLLRIKTEGSLILPLSLVSDLHYLESSNAASTVKGFLYGGIIFMLLYNAFLFLATRDISYIYYSLYLFSIFTILLQFNGTGFQYFWPNQVFFQNNGIAAVVDLMLVGIITFVQSLLETKRRIPRLHKFGLIILVVLLLDLLASLFMPMRYALQSSLILAAFSVIYNFVVAILIVRQGFSPARYYLAAWTAVLLSGLLFSVGTFGFVPMIPVIRYSLSIGVGMEVILLSLALANKINVLRDEKEWANVQLVKKRNQLSQLLEATKLMAQCNSKLSASSVALQQTRLVAPNLPMTDVFLYLRNKNGDAMVGYKLLDNECTVEQPIPFELESKEIERFLDLDSYKFEADRVYLSINSATKRLGIVELLFGSQSLNQNREDIEWTVLEGLIRSLAMVFEHLDSQEYERLSNIGAMAAAIVHDLKNPIGAIMGLSDLARDAQLIPAKREEYLEDINNEAKRLLALAQEVLEFSRGELKLEVKPQSCEAFFKSIRQSLSPLMQANHIEFHCDIYYQGTIFLDSERIRRVLFNLASNSVEAMKGADTKKPTFELLISEDANTLKILAKDNGPGIPKQIQATLFEPFTTHGKVHGTGLGMAIVKKVIDAHCGAIHFESEFEQGTQFTLTLPLTGAVETTVTSPSNREIGAPSQESDFSLIKRLERTPPLKVLVVDDNPVNQKILEKMLATLSIDCEVADNGQKGIEKAMQSKPDLILMDYEMPVMDGATAASKIRQDKELSDLSTLPIIALTGHDKSELEALKDGQIFNDYLEKPINKSQLIRCITKFA